MEELWYHVDVNSAFLSWSAAHEIWIKGGDLDLRTVPSVIGGNEKDRHGIVLAKSGPAARFGIRTGETLVEARNKCPGLIIAPPEYDLYVQCSRALIQLLGRYSHHIHQYSIDEAFCAMDGTKNLWGNPVAFAQQIGAEIRRTLGFTVNIGVSDNKLLAKMASEFQKPDKVHTLFKDEIPKKMWPLPVEDLFWVGRAASRKLKALGIRTIGDLAAADRELMRRHLKKHGEFIWDYANGRDNSPFLQELPENKGYGNSMTVPMDVTDADTARQVILSLIETVCARLRADGMKAGCVGISITDRDFRHASRQRTMVSATHTTLEMYRAACLIFEDLWDGAPIRQMGVHTSRVTHDTAYQYNLFDMDRYEKYARLDEAIDGIRSRYGEDSVMRAVFLGGRLPHMGGGIDKAKRTGMTKPLPYFPSETAEDAAGPACPAARA
ncbi:DNA polymerase IV [Enterocloster aldenensis]|uniref:DNA polymerase Y family protein n=1 Tax=Enterocloster aldenensis TaxID=358742 RepID=UPI003514F8FB